MFLEFLYHHTFRSILNGWHLLCQEAKVCFYRESHEELKDIFSQEVGVVFCNDVCSVMEVRGHEYGPDKRHFFIVSSKGSLKYSTTE